MNKFLFWFFNFLAIAVSAQNPVVEISTTDNPNEISICIDEKNPHRLLAGANIYSIYLSEDGGLSWSEKKQVSPYGVWGDPVVIQDTTGSFYHFHLSKVPDGNWIDRMVCQRSDDGGKSFNDGSFFGLNGGKAQDKPWAVVNPNNNEIYVTWTQFDEYDSKDPEDRSNILFSKSNDKGETWSDPIQVNSVAGDCLDDDDTVEGAVPAVGPDGQIYVAWSGPNGLVFNRSSDGGETWEDQEVSIADHVGGWNINIPGIYRVNGMPVTKCDLSKGPNQGTIYVNWADQRNGINNTDIFLSKSNDQGLTWSEPIRVNQDSSENHQFFTWMDIDQTNGNLWFVYHDRRNHNDTGTDVYAAVSQDGGITFTEVKISESPFYPNPKVFFGDYNNIAAHGNVVRPVWTKLDDEKLSVRTSIIDTYSIINKQSNSLTIQEQTNEGLIIEHALPGKVSVKILALNGKEVLDINRRKSKKGILKVPEASELTTGIYMVEIVNGSTRATGQWIKF
jgi:hypothetical protein